MTSCSLSSRDGYPLSPPACRSDPNWPARPVSILCTYAWCPVSQSRTSCGDSNTRCSAMVSSTTPRFGPRWPPVRATELTRCSLISPANAGSCEGGSRLTSAGEEIDDSSPGTPRVYVRAFARSEPRNPALAPQRTLDQIHRMTGGARAMTFPLVRRHRVVDDLGRHALAQLGPGDAQSLVGGRDGRLTCRRGEPREDEGLAAQDVVTAIVGGALVEQPGDSAALPFRGTRWLHLRRPTRRQGRRAHARSSNATHSTCAVMGNRSKARRVVSA